jgi:putative phosphotransacetylase
MKIPVEVSARHIHLSKKDLETLFGEGYQLNKIKQLSQPEEFVCEETVKIEFGSKAFERVRIVGPLRGETQVEVSLTDVVGSEVNPPIKLSGDLEDSFPVILVGPNGSVELQKGLIIAKRHIHCATIEAEKLGLKNNEVVSVKIDGERGLVFDNVIVRVNDNYKLSMHIDTDEGNSAGINKIGEGLIKK